MPSDRIVKINELLREQVAQIINEELDFEQGTIVSVVSASSSSDLRYAKIFVSILPDEKADLVISRLNNNAKNIQKHLAGHISFKFTPKLSFILDEVEKNASKIDELLDNLKY